MTADIAREGEGIACENWGKPEHGTPPHACSGIRGEGDTGDDCYDMTLAELARRHDVHPDWINDWKNQLLSKTATVFDGEPSPDERRSVSRCSAKVGEL